MKCRWAAFVAVFVVMGCGPGLAGRSQRELESPRDLATIWIRDTSGNAKAIRHLLRGSVTNGGVMFDDPICAYQFRVGEVPETSYDAFSRCLAALHWKLSPREDSLED